MASIEEATSLNQEGVALFSEGRYAAAEDRFRRAVAVGGPFLDTYLLNRGQALAKLGELSDAILHARRALILNPYNPLGRRYLSQHIFDLAQVLHRKEQFYAARNLYAEAIALAVSEDSVWHNELRKTVIPPNFPEVSLSGFPDILARRIGHYVTSLLYFFQELTSPISVHWAEENNKTHIPEQVDRLPDIATNFTVNTSGGDMATSYVVLNARYFEDASPIEIAGEIARSLAREAWKAKGLESPNYYPPSDTNYFSRTSYDRLIDQLVVFKGFGSWLLAYREYCERKAQGATETYFGMRPIEIRRCLRADIEAEAKLAVARGSDYYKQGRRDEAMREFSHAQETWAYVLSEEATYAFGHYESAIIFDWQGELSKAVDAGAKAVEYDPTNADYAEYLQTILGKVEVLRNKKSEAHRRLVEATSDRDKDVVSSDKLLRATIDMLADVVKEYPYWASGFHSIGLCCWWLQDYSEAIARVRMAVRLSPRNIEYKDSLEKLTALLYGVDSTRPKHSRSLGFLLWSQGHTMLDKQATNGRLSSEPEDGGRT